MKTAEEWIKELELIPHPEGGFYKRTGASNQLIKGEGGMRPLYTEILFLLTPESPSHFHRLKSDEVWYYHEGEALTVHSITKDGSYLATPLGKHPELGEKLQYTVPKGTIFGSSVAENYALVSCMVSPGFDFADFELFSQEELLKEYPDYQEIIRKLAFEKLP